jgi:putative ABC transport system permease protein
MTGRDIVREAVDSLTSHRLRAGLSALGIVAGVGTVVAALAIASGARRQAIADIGALGVDNVIIRAVRPEASGKQRPAPVLRHGDGLALSSRFPGSTVAVVRTIRDAAGAGDRSVEVTVAGVTPAWRTTMGLSVAAGRWIGDGDATARIAVLGSGLGQTLFRGSDPIGRTVLAAGEWRTIVGVLASSGARAGEGAVHSLDTDSALFVPLSTLDVSLGAGDEGDAVDQIVLRLPQGDDVVRGAAVAGALLRDRHASEAGSFEAVVPRELLRVRLRSQRTAQMLLMAIGGLALFIGGVGILNIMVASVTERTAEIGVRRAVGAPRSSVVAQFAAEAALLGGAGGLAGVPFGAVAAAAVGWIAGWPIAFSGVAIVGALSLALVVGLGAGIYPAYLAASVSPIDALRG